MQPQPLVELYTFPHKRDADRNILLVEDRQSDIELVEEALEDSNFSCNLYVVRNGEEALEFLSQRKQYEQVPQPHIILLDLNLPRMSGSELLSVVKQNNHLKLIPIIIFSTSSSSTDVINSYALDANCYIVKPASLDQFFTKIREIVNYWFVVTTLPHSDK